jgi:hypothetical protein
VANRLVRPDWRARLRADAPARHLPGLPGDPAPPRRSACFADDGSGNIYTKGAGSIVAVAGTLGIGLRPMNRRDSEAGYFATMGSNLNPGKGFIKFTVNSERIRGQFVRTGKGTFADQFEIIDPTPSAPTPPVTFTPPTTVPPVVTAPLDATGVGPARVGGPANWMLGDDGAVYPFGDYGSASTHRFGRSSPTPTRLLAGGVRRLNLRL